ncbi:oligosaccharide flippase family protein [Brevundimonas sp.]|uniref:lipopolysaccharide biosynthesis protein n=1 Tax=Brevundimonas sp. TaxID=1871086 RepID=UPI0026276750|nr:oligosaccharide flippase family protein [Brevundimonas sp.]
MSAQFKRLAFTVGATAIIQVSGVITGLIAARLLGPEGRGELASIVSFASVLSALGALSLQDGVVYAVARANDARTRDKALSAALAMFALLAPLAMFVCAGLYLTLFQGRTESAALIFLSNIPLNYATLAIVAYFQGGARHGVWNILRVLPMGTAAVVAVGYLTIGAEVSVLWFLLATMAGNAVLLGVAGAALMLSGFRPRPVDVEDVRTLGGYGLRLHPATLASNARDHLDRIVMTLMLPAAALGQYAAAATLAAALMLVGLTLDMVALPSLARSAGTPLYAERFGQLARLGLVVIAAGAASLAALSFWIVPFLFGRAFAEASLLTALLAVAYGLASMKTVLGLGLKAANEPLKVGMVEAVALGLLIVLMPPTILLFGSPGAAVAAIVAQAGSLAFMATIICRRLSLSPAELFMLRGSDFAALRPSLSRR